MRQIVYVDYEVGACVPKVIDRVLKYSMLLI